MEKVIEPIGVRATIRWSDTGEELEVYFSFGEYDEETDCDTFGVPDSEIFFYCTDEEEVQSFMIGDEEHCTLIGYEIALGVIGGMK